MWKYYALLSAIFASLTAICVKIGIKNVDSNLATAIRTCIILFITWGIVFAGDGIAGIKVLTKNNWIFLIFSGVATGLSWLFYFKAMQLGEVSKVAPIDKLSVAFTIILSFVILKEPVNWRVCLGGMFIVAGSLVMLLGKQ
ncbi:MAG: EamA family transporter [Prevotellaceae bacterium]|jgi:transporter family protein|nr:EamA family transporter [Prevotellaceae bacterium]